MTPNRFWRGIFPRTPKAVRRTAGIVALLLGLYGGYGIYTAVSWEVTGKGIYSLGKYDSGEVVTREGSPFKFRQATNRVWAWSTVCLVVATINFTFYRKLNECV